MLNLVSSYRVKTVSALPAGPLAANGDLRVLIGAGADSGLYLCTSDGIWSKQATILTVDGSTGVIAAGATATIAALIPAQTLVIGVNCRVTVLPPGPATFSVGDGADADRWGAGILVAAGTTTNIQSYTIASPVYYAAATNVVFTGNIAFTGGGTIIARVFYLQIGNV